jgi:hypothetical protein
VAARSKAWVCGRLVAGIPGTKPAEGMDVCLLYLNVVLSCVGTGLCDGLITRPEEDKAQSGLSAMGRKHFLRHLRFIN